MSHIIIFFVYLRADVVQLPIAQSPQNVLCGITSDPKVKSMERGEEFSPYLQILKIKMPIGVIMHG